MPTHNNWRNPADGDMRDYQDMLRVLRNLGASLEELNRRLQAVERFDVERGTGLSLTSGVGGQILRLDTSDLGGSSLLVGSENAISPDTDVEPFAPLTLQVNCANGLLLTQDGTTATLDITPAAGGSLGAAFVNSEAAGSYPDFAATAITLVVGDGTNGLLFSVSTGTLTVALLPASVTQAGIVDLGAQSFLGPKTIQNSATSGTSGGELTLSRAGTLPSGAIGPSLVFTQQQTGPLLTNNTWTMGLLGAVAGFDNDNFWINAGTSAAGYGSKLVLGGDALVVANVQNEILLSNLATGTFDLDVNLGDTYGSFNGTAITFSYQGGVANPALDLLPDGGRLLVNNVAAVSGTDEIGNVFVNGINTTLGFTGAGVPSGTMMLWAGYVGPAGWSWAHGGSIATTAQPALFSAIGYTYGGSGGTFTLPNMAAVYSGTVACYWWIKL